MRKGQKWAIGSKLKVREGTCAGRTGKVTKVEFYWGEWWYTVRIDATTEARGPESSYEGA